MGLAQRIAAAACFTCSAACVTAESVLVLLFLYWKASTFVLVTSKATCEASSCLLHLLLQRALHLLRQHTSAYVSIRQHASAHASMRQHASAYVSIRQHTSAYVSLRQHTSACVSTRQHASAYVSIRHTHTYSVRYVLPAAERVASHNDDCATAAAASVFVLVYQ